MGEINSWLLLILSVIGLFALYWVLFGQWKYNKMLREADEAIEQKSLAKEAKYEEKPADKAK
jgi:hypothetical protein